MAPVHSRAQGSTYNSPVEIFNMAKEEMLEQSGGGWAAAAAASSADHWTRPDDPMTGEYLKLERQRVYKGSIDSRWVEERTEGDQRSSKVTRGEQGRKGVGCVERSIG